MKFRTFVTPNGNGVDWEVKVIIPELMTPDRQIAKGTAPDSPSAYKQMATVCENYERKHGVSHD